VRKSQRMRKRFAQAAYLAAACAFSLLLPACAQGDPEPSASPSGTPIPTPTATPVPTRTPSENDLVPTVTPSITFVPLPTSKKTPDRHGNTPSPTPNWAAPHPSPTGAPLVTETSWIELGTVRTEEERGIYVKRRVGYHGGALGTVQDGQQFKILGYEDDSWRILYNGQEGYLPADALETESIELAQRGVIEYTIGTLNVHGIRSNARFRRLTDVLTEADLDVVGIQEVDRETDEDTGEDWLVKLADAAGYPYYTFCQTMELDEGVFGTAILSKHPIIDANTWKLEVSRGKEPRSLAHAAILLDKGIAHVFNTHLCASSMHLKSVNIASMAYTLRAAGVSPYTVTGDFNCSPPRIYHYLPEIRFANMDRSTFGDGSRPKILDNILYTEGIVLSDVQYIDTVSIGATDHMFPTARVHVLIPEEE